MANLIDLTGQTFGKLTVLHLDEDRSNSKRKYWHCVCDCGTEKSILYANLSSGTTTSCGCQRIEKKDLTGLKVGKLTVLNLDHIKTNAKGWRKAYYNCQCDCGKSKVIAAENLTKSKPTISCDRGETKCIGEWFYILTNEGTPPAITQSGVATRIKKGWSPHEAFFTPHLTNNPRNRKP